LHLALLKNKTQKYLNLNKGFLALPSLLKHTIEISRHGARISGGDLPSSLKHTIEISRHGAAQH
jgi:hypothetical protein